MFEDYLAVLDSDLYEYHGTTKAILARIAHLIIGPPDEGPDGKPKWEPSPDEGYCTASQEYIACQYGISAHTVGGAVREFVKDGWLIAEQYRNKRGYLCYKYRWATSYSHVSVASGLARPLRRPRPA